MPTKLLRSAKFFAGLAAATLASTAFADGEPRTYKWDNNGGDNCLTNGANWYVDGSDPLEHGYAPTSIDSCEVTASSAYAALNEGEAFNAKSLYIGGGSDYPVVDITNGTFTVEEDVNIGHYGNRGEMNIYGGTISAVHFLVGDWESHDHNVLNVHGGTITLTGMNDWLGDAISIGHFSGSRGDMMVSGGTVNATKNVIVGLSTFNNDYERNASTLTMTGGMMNITGGMRVAYHEDSACGRVTIGGGTLSMTEDLNISNTSNSWGQVDITGGSVTIGGTIRVGNHKYAQHAVLNVAGGTLDVKSLSLARECDATLRVTDGGTIYAESIDRSQDSTANPYYYFDNGTVVAKSGYAYTFASAAGITLGAGGLTFDTAGYSPTIQAYPSIDGIGGITKKGEGKLELVANSFGFAGTYNAHGVIKVDAGTLKLPANQTIYCEGTQVADGATLDLNGSTIVIVTKKIATSCWTNATGDGNAANAANWRSMVKYYDEDGDAIDSLTATLDGVLPTADSIVRIPRDLPYPSGLDESSVKGVFIVASGDISLIIDGDATYDAYSGGSFAVSGAVRFMNNLNGLLSSAVAWYDPSDQSTLTMSDAGVVTRVANKGYLGSAMDAVQDGSDAQNGAMLSTDEVPGCEYAQWKQNGHNVLVFTNNHGFASATKMPGYGEGQPRALFSVAARQNIANMEGNIEMMTIEMSDDTMWSDPSGRTIISQGPYGDYDDYAAAQVVIGGETQYKNFAGFHANYEGRVNLLTLNARANGAVATCRNLSSSDDKFNYYTQTIAYDKILGTADYRVRYGRRCQWDTKSKGLLGEALAFVSELSDDAAAAVEGYLADKWLGDDSALRPIGTTYLDALILENANVDMDGAPVSFGTLGGDGSITNASSVAIDRFVVHFTDGTVDGVASVYADSIDISSATLSCTGMTVKPSSDRTVVMRFEPGTLNGKFRDIEFDRNGYKVFYDRTAGTISIGRVPGFSIRIQ